MPPQLALLLSLGLSAALVWRELRLHPNVSKAAWIPCIWLLILGSRSVSQWLNLSTPNDADLLMEGSPTDRNVFIVLMASAIAVLWSRRLAWTTVLRQNPWLVLFFVYCALSILWSDFPGVALRRWVKSLGDPLMVLVLLSEANPATAVASVLRRCAFILVPLSIVFIKYFPHLGRTYETWSGLASYTGVTTNKNMLGYLLFVSGLYFICAIATKAAEKDLIPRMRRRVDTAIAVAFLLMLAYLFRMANSMTPLLALFVATGIVAGFWIQPVRRHFGVFASLTLILASVLQLFFGAAELVIASAGRDTTFTGRTELWPTVLAMVDNPMLGAGFRSFWLGDRLAAMWQLFPVFRPNQAHNGYIDVYLDLGLLGLFVVGGVIVSAYRVASHKLTTGADASGAQFDEVVFAKFGMSYLVAFLLYNVTEAIIHPLHPLFIIFLIVALRTPQQQRVARATATQRVESEALSHPMAGAPAAAYGWRPTRHPSDTGGRLSHSRERFPDNSGRSSDGTGPPETGKARAPLGWRGVGYVEKSSGSPLRKGRVLGRHLSGHGSSVLPPEPHRRGRG
jgi:O-antigen ligase